MASKILIGIALDGDSEVKRKLQEVGEAGKRSLEGIDKNLGGAQNKIRGAVSGVQEALAPLTKASGLGGLLEGGLIGSLLGKIASPGGFLAGLGAAITGALVGMAKIGEESQRVKGRLAALNDPKGFDKLTDRAKVLGTDVAGLQPRYERFLQLQQKLNADNTSVIRPPGFQPGAAEEAAAQVDVIGGGKQRQPPSREAFGKFDSALLSQIRRDVKSGEDARGIADQFQETLAQTGLTPDLLRSLQRQSPSGANFLTSQLSKNLGQGFENPNALATAIERGRLPDLNATRVINAGAKPNPEAEEAARKARGFTQGAEALQASIGRIGENAGGDVAGLGPMLDKAAQFIDSRNRPPAPLPGLSELLGTYFNKNTPLPERPGAASNLEQSFSSVDVSASKTSSSLEALAAALEQAATNIRNGTPGNTQPVQQRAGGGYIRGAGTTTSDSIPALLSDKEYVVNAKGTSKAGLAHLDWLNAGMPGYADGGSVIPGAGGLVAGNYDITPTDDGGAIINGVMYPPGSPILNDPNVKAALARARAARGQSEGKKHKSDFTGIFGGHVFDTPGSYARGGAVGRGLRRFASGGYVNILPHFADGGLADIGGAMPVLSGSAAASGAGSMGHMDVDLRTNHGDYKMMASGDVARAMAAAARDSADVQTGPRPSWYKGR